MSFTDIYEFAISDEAPKEEPTESIESDGYALDVVEKKYVQGMFNNHNSNLKRIQDSAKAQVQNALESLDNIEYGQSDYDLYLGIKEGNDAFYDSGENVKLEYYRVPISATRSNIYIKIPGFFSTTQFLGGVDARNFLLRRPTPDSDDLSTFLGDSTYSTDTILVDDAFLAFRVRLEVLNNYSYSNGDDPGSNLGVCILFTFDDDFTLDVTLPTNHVFIERTT